MGGAGPRNAARRGGGRSRPEEPRRGEVLRCNGFGVDAWARLDRYKHYNITSVQGYKRVWTAPDQVPHTCVDGAHWRTCLGTIVADSPVLE